MASSTSIGDSLLPSPTNKSRSFFKPFFIFLSLATLISLVIFAPHHLTVHLHPTNLQPSDLCVHSPNPTNCAALLSDSASAGAVRSPTFLLHSLLRRSLLEIHASLSQSTDLLRQINDPHILDCVDLLDLSRDRILSSNAAIAAGSYGDARTWLSAVLTNHVTCLDGLKDPSPLKAHLDSLTEQASAALAVLRAITVDDGQLTETVTELPSWVSPVGRKLLEATSLAAIKADVTVDANGGGNYKTVQAAVNAAPDNGKARFVIYVKKGTYKENVIVGKKKKNLTIVGDGQNATIITGSLNFVDGSTTYNSATLAAMGDGFILQDLCVENTAGPAKHQAVALRINADQAVVNRCQIRAYQDTLYAHSLRQFYRDSLISGTVDFIFGNAAVVFQNSNLQARKPMAGQKNAVTAQGRIDPNQNTGTSIQKCRLVPSQDLKPVTGSFPTYLGRPWKEYSRTVVMQSSIDNHVNPKGWLEWDGNFALKTLFYGEYQNDGPGAGTAGRVNWTGYHVITDAKVANDYTVAKLIQGEQWLTGTGVDFTNGL
ncbi:pectinesterase [Dendrobium catenatum]|uniref:Pectinesterase n=1 Tax=Dendrobium catenatum TaxID=906689 RepID=A0A2I0W1U0_9ASPA|nr:pectinesterase [Dendrobium catenatum]PKU69625.1 Pectinesterase 2.1 [Dendrobium catenatum]